MSMDATRDRGKRHTDRSGRMTSRAPSSASRWAPRRGVAVLACLILVSLAVTARSDYATRAEVVEYIDGLVAEHGFDRDWLTDVMAEATKSETVIERISTPAEKALAWHEYRRIFLTDKRIDGGVEFWHRNRAAIDAATAKFAVPGEIIVSIIGVETFYGRYLGSHRVIDALATLAFDYPPRSAFFTRELTEFLLLVREEGKDPLEPKGSYAGAMGYGQFISSSYRHYAIDFDGDNKRDIWTNQTDAVGSVANYFARHDWRGKGRVAVRVEITDDGVLDIADTGLELKRTAGDFRAKGATIPPAIGDEEKAALFTMETEGGAEYWLGLHDFYVITRYNHSAMYALAVLQLSQEIRQRFASGNVDADSPPPDRPKEE